jgi:hypothetical protein
MRIFIFLLFTNNNFTFFRNTKKVCVMGYFYECGRRKRFESANISLSLNYFKVNLNNDKLISFILVVVIPQVSKPGDSKDFKLRLLRRKRWDSQQMLNNNNNNNFTSTGENFTHTKKVWFTILIIHITFRFKSHNKFSKSCKIFLFVKKSGEHEKIMLGKREWKKNFE